jgi:hypothetical protein
MMQPGWTSTRSFRVVVIAFLLMLLPTTGQMCGTSQPAGSIGDLLPGSGLVEDAEKLKIDTAFTDALYWTLGGNAGTDPTANFIGTTDDKPLVIKVNNQQAVRMEAVTNGGTTALNYVAGYSGNAVADGVIAGTIAGGGMKTLANTVTSIHGTVSGGVSNTAGPGTDATVGGGLQNTAGGHYSVIPGGWFNTVTVGGRSSVICGGESNHVSDWFSVIAGGYSNTASGIKAVISGGQSNTASAEGAVVSGGVTNAASGTASTVPGGAHNTAGGVYSFAAGYAAKATRNGSFVWSDISDPNVTFASTADNQFSIRAAGGVRVHRPTQGAVPTSTNAALQVENFLSTGEAGWFRMGVPSSTVPVMKLNRYPGNLLMPGLNNFLEGVDWDGTNAPVPKFHVDRAGTFVAGSDVAEALAANGSKGDYQPGDVLVLCVDRPKAVEKCRHPYDTKVAGVYSTRPGMLGADKGGQTRVDENDIPVAITGIVPTKVTTENGAIKPGDLLTTSSTVGHAMKAKPTTINGVEIYPTGTIVGKAMEPLERGTGTISMLMTLR